MTLNPGILEKLKHEIGELLTQRCVTSQLKLGSRGLCGRKGDRLLRDCGQDIKPEICAVSANTNFSEEWNYELSG